MMEERHYTLEVLHTYVAGDGTGRNDSLLDDWAADVISREDYSFESGLLGLGWLVGYLIEHGYIEGDADEILEDIDDTLYKLTIKEVLDKNVDILNLLHYVTYYQQRLQYPSKAHFYRRFTHFECLKLLLEKLNIFLLENRKTMTKSTIRDRINIVLKYSYLSKTCINEKLLEEAFYPTVEGLITYFESIESRGECFEEIAKLYITARQYENPYWEEKLKRLLDHMISGQASENVWILLASRNTWQHEYFIQIAKIDRKSKTFLFQALTNIKTNDQSA